MGKAFLIFGRVSKTTSGHNTAINADSEKRRVFVAPLFTAGYDERWASITIAVR